MLAAQYVALLMRACPSITIYQAEWEIPLAKGWALIHAGRLLEGEAMIWPDPSLSRIGRWWQSFKSRFTRH